MANNLEHFSKRARRVLTLAQEEAQRLNHNYIGTEHLLLGLVLEENGVAKKVLLGLGVDPRQVVMAVERTVGLGARSPLGKPVLAPRVQKVITLAADAARQMEHKYIGTEHLLLGIIHEGEGMAAQILRNFVPLDRIGAEITTAILPRTEMAEIIRTGEMKRLFPLLQIQTWIGGRSDEAAIQAERTRLARDLHDSVKQQLFSISISAAAVQERWTKDPDGALAALADVQQSAQAAMVEMDALLKQLRPNPLETAGLIDALREQCEALAFRTGAEVTTFLGELPPEAQLSTMTHATIFRIVQEALANIARHARASRVHVRLENDPASQMLRLEVRDDGQGFDRVSVVGGMGLTNMAERAQGLGGQLTLESAPDQGTLIRLEIPLLPPSQELTADAVA